MSVARINDPKDSKKSVKWRYEAMSIVSGNHMMRATIFILFILISFSSKVQPMGKTKETIADMVLYGGTIYTVDEQNPEAEAVAIQGDRIVFVGRKDEVKKWIGDATHVIDLKGKTVVPGLIDSHGHLEWYGRYQEEVDLHGTKSFDDVLARLKIHINSAEPDKWILGRGWDQEDWDDNQLPTHERLSAISPDNPVWLERDGAHAYLANARAMTLAGVDKNTPNPEGGQIIKSSSTGEPTGIFIDRANSLITNLFPPPTREEKMRYILKAVEDGVAVGLTGVHDPGVSYEDIEIFKELAAHGRLKLRVYAMLGGNEVYLDNYYEHPCMIGFANNHFTMRSIKIAIDGAMGSRGALLLEDYSDQPGHRGSVVTEPELIKGIAVDALKNGFQLSVHAIGDGANRLTLDMFEEALKKNPLEDHRFRIEHLQLISLSDIPRLTKLGVIPSMQQSHCIADMAWAEDRVGPERVHGNYAWRKILDSGAIIAGGSDFPIVPIDPLWSFYVSVTRQNAKGWPPEGWHPEERMTMEEALKSFTIWAAYAAFEEDIKGSITPGKLADMVVFSKNIMKITPVELLETKALLTIVGGRIVYRDESVW